MCQRNWRQYNASLVQRGSLTFFCHPDLVRSIKHASRAIGPKGGRPPYSAQLLLLLFLLKISYGLTYRSCEGMARSLLEPHSIAVPSYSTICRGIRRLTEILPRLSQRRPKTLLVDSSGFKITGEGEWKTKIHGKSYRRSWVKVHLLVDSDSNEIVDLLVTPCTDADSKVGSKLLYRITGTNKTILGDGAYDGRGFRKQAFQQGLHILAPPPKNAKLQNGAYLEARNDAIRIIASLGGDLIARRLWGKLTGYSHRAKVEGAFSRLKRLFGAGLFSRKSAAQATEVWMKALLSNLWLSWN
jgi:hypothetical protein